MRIPSELLVLIIGGLASAAPVHLRCEYMENPLGIDSRVPHFSWQSDSPERNWKQSAYQLLVASSLEALRSGKADVWDSGRRQSAVSVDLAYGGPALQSGRRYYWIVRVWDRRGRMIQATEPAWWEMGLLSKADWKAKWIAAKDEEGEDRKGIRLIGVDMAPGAQPASATFRLSVQVKERPRVAALFVAAGGGLKTTLNSSVIRTKRSWASFDRQDIADRLAIGENVIEVTTSAKRAKASFAGLLKLTYADGSIERYPSGELWQAKLTTDAAWRPAGVGEPLGEVKRGFGPGNLPEPASLLRKEFEIAKRVQSARIYVTALGSYRLFLNPLKYLGATWRSTSDSPF